MKWCRHLDVVRAALYSSGSQYGSQLVSDGVKPFAFTGSKYLDDHVLPVFKKEIHWRLCNRATFPVMNVRRKMDGVKPKNSFHRELYFTFWTGKA